MSSKTLVPPTVPTPHAPPEPPALEAFLDKHFRQILIAVGVLIVVLLVYGVMRYRSHQEAEAAAMEATQAKTVDDCDLVIQHHPGTVAAGNALLAKAKLLWDQNKKDTAVASLRDFVQKYPDHPFHVQGMIGLGSRLEAMGKDAEVAEAKALYEKVVSEQGKSDLAGLAQLRLADMLWNQGKEAEAKKLYESLPSRLTGSPFFDQNEERLKWLASGLPTKEVEGPKPPPEPPASLKAPTPKMNLNSKGGSQLGDVFSKLQKAVPGAKMEVNPSASKANPVAVPAEPKPGLATPGASIALPGPGKTTSAAPGATITVPPVPKSPAAATTPPVQVPAPAPAPAPAAAAPKADAPPAAPAPKTEAPPAAATPAAPAPEKK